MSFTVAIDGPAAAGKGTLSRAVAGAFGFRHLDTGLLYRATGMRVLDGLDPVAAAEALVPSDLEREGLRSAEAAAEASRAAAIPGVRAALLAFQRDFARDPDGAVLDGRDIGTVICPEAEVKLFVTARAEIRARRRFEELRAGGAETQFETVLADVRERDARDMDRADAPLRPAKDAVVLDTSDLTIAEATARAVQIVASRRRMP
ncbi:cytidylate kinase [Palleronia aestuarii]|uniref:Cytidylate kinase n=1 Tax=Palleronia aestuarii TaxID=568105 RepID=A0A2W7NCZ0_9RHOB|nr:(d)CMP kinase [Palleronia aestuarii]PZX18251.1 cytidylate kinase [Palleronia aestuarii]